MAINSTYKKPFFTSAPSAESYLGDLKSDGSVALTANWLGNAYQISRLVPVLALTDGATQTITAAQCQNYVRRPSNLICLPPPLVCR
jgi:hypothetical protein